MKREALARKRASKARLVPALALCVLVGAALTTGALAQELEPRAFSPAPVGTSFAIAGYGQSNGAFVLDSSAPIGDVEADIDFAVFVAGYTFQLFDRQARVMATASYAWGELSGDVGGIRAASALEGFSDPRIKLSVGLLGAPALGVEEFGRRESRTAIGASLTVVAPWGQYDGEAVANLGANRWAFKPELGVSHPVGDWTLEGSAGVWLFTDNDNYQGAVQSREPLLSLQGHVGYTFDNGAWLAADAAWFAGGRTEVDGVESLDRQENTRIGITFSWPVAPRNSIKLTYSTGASTRRGSDFDTFNVTWQVVRF